MDKSASCKDKADLPRTPARSEVTVNTLTMSGLTETSEQHSRFRKLDIALNFPLSFWFLPGDAIITAKCLGQGNNSKELNFLLKMTNVFLLTTWKIKSMEVRKMQLKKMSMRSELWEGPDVAWRQRAPRGRYKKELILPIARELGREPWAPDENTHGPTPCSWSPVKARAENQLHHARFLICRNWD